MHLATQLLQTEGSWRQASDIHPGGRMASEKSSVHIMQLTGEFSDGMKGCVGCEVSHGNSIPSADAGAAYTGEDMCGLRFKSVMCVMTGY